MSYEEEIAWGVRQMLDADLQFPQEVHYSKKPVRTNADHIRSMTDEELLGCLLELQDTAIKRFANFELPNYQWMADWLKQPYGGDT